MTTSNQSYTPLIPILGVTSVVGVFVLYSWSLGPLPLGPLDTVVLENSKDQLIALRGAFLFAVSATILTVALLYVIWLGVHVFRHTKIHWETVSFRKTFVAVGLMLIIAGMILALGGHVGDPVTNALQKAIADISPGIEKVPLVETITFVEVIILANNLLAVIAIMSAVVMSTILLIAVSQTEGREDLPPLIRKSQLVLYSTAMLLTVGVVEFFFLFRWGGDLLNLNRKLWVVDSVVRSLTLGFGIFFSALLIILFVPLLLVQRDKLKELNTGPVEVRSEWLDQHGLSRSLFPALAQIVALLMPLATSLLPI